MHQFDVPESAARALAANRIRHEASRGSWSQTRGVFILNTKILFQDTQSEFYDITTGKSQHHAMMAEISGLTRYSR